MQVKVIVELYDGIDTIRTEVTCLEREALSNENCGLTMSEAKALLVNVQQATVSAQAAAHLQQNSACLQCGQSYRIKDKRNIIVRTLFGKLRLPSPRYHACHCQNPAPKQSFSPLPLVLPERTTPELRYLQCKWSVLLSFGMTSQLLGNVLPLERPINTAVLSRQVQKTAERAENELGAEQAFFGWEDAVAAGSLPAAGPPINVGIDGGWVHGREGANRKAGSFELIVGKSIPEQGAVRRLGFVNGYDRKPRRRLFELLRSQGAQPRQQVIFLSDGGDTVRNLQLYLHPLAEHLLDWFHVAQRLRVIMQLAKALACRALSKPDETGHEAAVDQVGLEHQAERVKWYLWHGNVHKALLALRQMAAPVKNSYERSEQQQKLLKKMREFDGYICANADYVVNYGDRYRNGERISTAFVEATVNELISKRMVKKQQMRWTKAGAHRLLQLRVRVLDGELGRSFARWYPGVHIGDSPLQQVAHTLEWPPRQLQAAGLAPPA